MDIRPETMKFLENIVGKVLNTDLDNKFLDLTPKAKGRKAEINKWNYIKLKDSVQQRKLSIKRQPMEWKKNFEIIC